MKQCQILPHAARLAIAAFLLPLGNAFASALSASYITGDEVPVSAAGYTALGEVNLSLGFAPAPGTQLTVVENTALGFIQGEFTNLTHGQTVSLGYGGFDYKFVANYYGGTGNDLVLVWAGNRLFGWGDSLNGQLGQGYGAVEADTTDVLAGKFVVQVAAGSEHAIALCEDGTIAAWGGNFRGELGIGTGERRRFPVAVNLAGVLAGKRVIQVGAGQFFSVALCDDGTIATWGDNTNSTLGDGTNFTRWLPGAVDTSGVLAGKTITKLAVGPNHVVVLCSDGTLAAWGSNAAGKLGDGTNINRSSPVKVNTGGLLAGKTVIQLAAGSAHTFALCQDGTLIQWGTGGGPLARNNFGVLAGKTPVQVSAGYQYNVVLCSDGTIAAWGENSSGQLGDGTTTVRNAPVTVKTDGVLAGKTVVQVDAGLIHTVALCSDGTLVSWGKNSRGELGDGTTTDRRAPVTMDMGGVLTGKTVVQLAAGSKYTSVLCEDGTLASWGERSSGQLGDGSTTYRTVPVAADQSNVLSGKTIFQVAAGSYHTVALSADGTLAAWGDNSKGQLGNGTTADSMRPVAVNTDGVLTGKTVIQVAAGGSNTAALCKDGTLVTWGNNLDGQLGNGTTTDSSIPVAVNTGGVLAGKTITQLTVGRSFMAVLCEDGTLVAWGSNSSGQLGDGTNINSSLPVTVFKGGVLAGKTIVSISAGSSHALAFCADGTLATWGNSTGGQLGSGTSSNQNKPVLVYKGDVLAGKTIIQTTTSASGTTAMSSDGTLAAWGSNASGQIGDGTKLNRFVPVAVNSSGVLAGRTIKQVVRGDAIAIALFEDGGLARWGDASFGVPAFIQDLLPVAMDSIGGLSGRSIIRLAAGGDHTFALAAEEQVHLQIRDPSNTVLTNGAGVLDIGEVALGASGSIDLTVTNQGPGTLRSLVPRINGVDREAFSASWLPAFTGLTGGQSATLRITFSPERLAFYDATLFLVSDDDPESPFQIRLSGTIDGQQFGNLFYSIVSGQVTITGCNTGASGDLVIPAIIDGMPVVSIGGNVFANCSRLSSVTIPASVTMIGANAFAGAFRVTRITFLGNAPILGTNALAGVDSKAVVSIPYTATGYGITFGGRSVMLQPVEFGGLVPPNPGVSQQWWLHMIQASEAWQFVENHHSGPRGHEANGGDPDIAILDGGFVSSSPDFPGRDESRDFDFSGLDPLSWNQNGNGSKVASLAAARGVESAYFAGVDPDSELMMVRLYDESDVFLWNSAPSAVTLARNNHVEVILFGSGKLAADALAGKIDEFVDGGGVFVSPASNNPIQTYFPANHPGVIAVAAVDRLGRSPVVYQAGARIMCVAPGFDLRVPNPFVYPIDPGSVQPHQIQSASGNVYAAALVAGAFGLVSDVVGPQVLDAAFAEELLALSCTPVPGQTLPRDPTYGYGLLNVYNMVRMARILAGQGDRPSVEIGPAGARIKFHFPLHGMTSGPIENLLSRDNVRLRSNSLLNTPVSAWPENTGAGEGPFFFDMESESLLYPIQVIGGRRFFSIEFDGTGPQP